MKNQNNLIWTNFLLILILSAFVSAEFKKEVYNNVLSQGGNFTVENTNFRIPLTFSNKAVIFINDTGYTIDKGLCETQGLYTICLQNIETIAPKYINEQETYKARISVSRFLALISITMDIVDSELEIGGETTGTIIIANNGTIKAENVSVEEYFPKQFQINELSGCSFYDGEIFFEGELLGETQKTCTFKIKALENISYKFKINASYFNGISIQKLTSIEKDVKVLPNPLSLLLSFDRMPSTIDERFNLYLTIANNHPSKEMNVVNMEVKIPEGISVYTLPDRFKQSYNKFSWSGIIVPNESANFYIELKTVQYGMQNITLKTAFIFNSKRYESIDNKLIVLENPKKDVRLPARTEMNSTLQGNSSEIQQNAAPSNLSENKKNESSPKPKEIIRESLVVEGRRFSYLFIVGGFLLGLVILFGFIFIVKKHNANAKVEVEEFKKRLNKEIEKETRMKTDTAEKMLPKKEPIKSKKKVGIDDDLIKTREEGQEIVKPEPKKEKISKEKESESRRKSDKSSFRF